MVDDLGPWLERIVFLITGIIIGLYIPTLKDKQEKGTSFIDHVDRYHTDEYKMVIIVNVDLKMGKGKIAAQVGHGAVAAAQKCLERSIEKYNQWDACGSMKICVKGSGSEFQSYLAKAKTCGVLATLIRDAGHTQIPSGSQTVIALGPDKSSSIDQVTGSLKLL